MGKKLTEIEAAIRVRMSPALLRWFTGHAPKHGSDRKLIFTKTGDEYFFDSDELDSFNAFLQDRWPIPKKQTRPPVPAGIEREIICEANHKCAFCEYIAHGEGAHIDPVSRSGCNHPHNLIWTCPNHHTEYDHGLKVTSVVKADHVRVIKEVLLEKQLRHWRIELRAVSSLLSLIEQLERIMGYLNDPNLLEIHESLQTQAKEVLKMVSKEAAKPAPTTPPGAPKVTTSYAGFLRDIRRSIPRRRIATKAALDDVVEEVVGATENYLLRDSLAKCPLCEGSGAHNRLRCDICAGEGTVSADTVDEIDLRPYKQVDCPLCEGSGTHNRFDCPVCHGVGTIDRRDEDEIDLTPFKQVDCPLCEGKGTRKGGFECAVCHGMGTIDRGIEDDLDLSPFKQVECPLCEGSRRHKGGECPVCRGNGEIDRGYADNIDLDMFRE